MAKDPQAAVPSEQALQIISNFLALSFALIAPAGPSLLGEVGHQRQGLPECATVSLRDRPPSPQVATDLGCPDSQIRSARRSSAHAKS